MEAQWVSSEIDFDRIVKLTVVATTGKTSYIALTEGLMARVPQGWAVTAIQEAMAGLIETMVALAPVEDAYSSFLSSFPRNCFHHVW
jgi:hypothetical protein